MLPQSKKTRALLAYLVLSGRPHRRERLCSLLWDVADDPRGALRWSLSKLRGLLDDPGARRLAASRETVAFEAHGAWIDCLMVRGALAGGVSALSTDRLVELAALHRGELLEGLDLPDFHEYQAWCAAEREQARRQRAVLLREVVERTRAEPERALPFARELSQVDALDEHAHASLLELLLATDRAAEAREYYDSARRVLGGLGGRGPALVDAVWRERSTGSTARTLAPAPPPVSSAAVEREPLVGRERELAALAAALERLTAGARSQALLVTGEPGVGKSRLVLELAAQARRAGISVRRGSAYEAETNHPYACFVDALGALPAAANREELFGAVAGALAASGKPLLLLLDDVQWCDEASTSLLHHLLRQPLGVPLCVVLTARAGELFDNAAILRLLRGLRRERLLSELPLEPLGREAISALVGAADAERIFERSAGNPLFALELVRSGVARGDDLPETLTELVRDRIARLPQVASDLLRWAAVAGKRFHARKLEAITSLSADELVGALEALERHQLLRAEDDGSYSFTHDLVRAVAYADLSDPRRRLMHLSVARALERFADEDGVVADLAHHAALGGDALLASRACVKAGRRCLRLFANAEAAALARRGRTHAEVLPESERVPLLLELLHVSYGARRPERADAAAWELQMLAERALDLGQLSQARLGFHLLSYLRWEGGAWSDAERHALEAERISRSSDEAERMVALAEAGRCLAMLERDLGQAEALLLEAQALSRRIGREPGAVADARGLLAQHEGRLDDARELFRRSRAVARAEGDRASEFQALEHLVALELGAGEYGRVRTQAAELAELARKLREGSELPFARGLAALSAYALGEPGAADGVERAIAELRAADAKHRLAFVLSRAAAHDLERGEARRALDRASEALSAARLLDRASELALSLGIIAAASERLADRAGAARARSELGAQRVGRASAEVRSWLAAHVSGA